MSKKAPKKKPKTCEFVIIPERRPLTESDELKECFKNPLIVVENGKIVVDRLEEFWQREGVEIA